MPSAGFCWLFYILFKEIQRNERQSRQKMFDKLLKSQKKDFADLLMSVKRALLLHD